MSDLVPRPSARASDADRDHVLAILSTATADGRLTVEEHHELMEQTLHARTMGELDVITQDLQTTERPVPAPTTPLPAPSKLGMFGHLRRANEKGQLAGSTEFKATAVFGAVELDFREAQFDAPEVLCVANSVFGAVEITVPDWVRVIDEGSAVFGAREDAAPSEGSTTVTLRLKGFTAFGAVDVKRKAPKLRRGATPLQGPTTPGLDAG